MLYIVTNWWEQEIMQRGDCFDSGDMLTHFYFISSGITVKFWQAFQDVLAQVRGVILYLLSSEGYLHK